MQSKRKCWLGKVWRISYLLQKSQVWCTTRIHIFTVIKIENINFAQIRVANSAENFSVSGIFSGQTTENLNHYSVTTEQFHLLELPFLSEKMGSKHWNWFGPLKLRNHYLVVSQLLPNSITVTIIVLISVDRKIIYPFRHIFRQLFQNQKFLIDYVFDWNKVSWLRHDYYVIMTSLILILAYVAYYAKRYSSYWFWLPRWQLTDNQSE